MLVEQTRGETWLSRLIKARSMVHIFLKILLTSSLRVLLLLDRKSMAYEGWSIRMRMWGIFWMR